MCYGCSKEPSHSDSSFEYPQHMLWMKKKKIIFLFSTLNQSPGKFKPVVLEEMWLKEEGYVQTGHKTLTLDP